ncbi:MAG: adenosine deaminase [Anaerolineae bacterium]|nr:adenosine deaminase [Anaerolineae bacterium]
MSASDSLHAAVAALPKIELHRHLEGSLRLSTLRDVAQEFQLSVPRELDSLRPLAQITAESPYTIEHFLSKFDFLRQFYCSPEVIQRVVREAIEDAAADNIRYMELRFTPKALAKQRGFAFADVVRWVTETTAEAQRANNIRVNLIASVNRHESVAEAAAVLEAVAPYRDRGVVAFDLAGQEAGYTNAPFYDLFSKARNYGFFVTVHAGEWAGATNIYDAITYMQAARIGHGVRIVEDIQIVELARQAGATFEVCLSSNVHSGVVKSVSVHPLPRMMELGLSTAICTDDPSVSAITLTDEINRAITDLGLTPEQVKTLILAAARSSFLPANERDALIADFTQQLSTITKLESEQ